MLRSHLRFIRLEQAEALAAINNQLSKTIAANSRAWENQVKADCYAEYLPPQYVQQLSAIVESRTGPARGLYKASVTKDKNETIPTPTKPLP
jgi:hypothetical protein